MQGSPIWLVVGKCEAQLHGAATRRMQGGPLSLTSGLGKVMEQIILRCCHTACAGLPWGQAEPAQVYERQLLLDQPDLLLWQGNLRSGWGKCCRCCLLGLKQSFWHSLPQLQLWRTCLVMLRQVTPLWVSLVLVIYTSSRKVVLPQQLVQ